MEPHQDKSTDKHKDKEKWEMTAEGSVLVPDAHTEPRMEAGGAVEEPNDDREPRMTGEGAEQVSDDHPEPEMTASGSVMHEEPERKVDGNPSKVDR